MEFDLKNVSAKKKIKKQKRLVFRLKNYFC